jgi:hypothetical protein
VHEQDRWARAKWAANVERSDDAAVAPEGGSLLRAGDFRRMGLPSPDPTRRMPMHPLHVQFVGYCLAYQCREDTGFHWVADQFLAEILDQDTGRLASDRATGELVVTDLVREASPLVRYRTGLEVSFTQEPCACGRTSGRVLAARSLT